MAARLMRGRAVGHRPREGKPEQGQRDRSSEEACLSYPSATVPARRKGPAQMAGPVPRLSIFRVD
jgi:hypothetical protein